MPVPVEQRAVSKALWELQVVEAEAGLVRRTGAERLNFRSNQVHRRQEESDSNDECCVAQTMASHAGVVNDVDEQESLVGERLGAGLAEYEERGSAEFGFEPDSMFLVSELMMAPLRSVD